MKRLIYPELDITASTNLHCKKRDVVAQVIDDTTYEQKKSKLTYQFKEDGYKVYSEPGHEQYTWNWYAVPYGGTK
jgi:hypothetical protein